MNEAELMPHWTPGSLVERRTSVLQRQVMYGYCRGVVAAVARRTPRPRSSEDTNALVEDYCEHMSTKRHMACKLSCLA